MSTPEIFVNGIGAVSPAGWGVPALREALIRKEPIPIKDLPRPGWERPLRIRQTPTASPRPAFMAHARLRRTSPIAQFVVSAAIEALGDDASKLAGGWRLGIVFCAMTGCVNYSRRFYDEVLKDASTASPLVFPETVYNSPASHLAALLGTTAINYTLVGDPGTFLQGIALAADWLSSGRVDGCLAIGAEEMDWLTADATRLFDRSAIISDGSGAVYLTREPRAQNVKLSAITDSHLFHSSQSRREAALRARKELLSHHGPSEILCDGLQGAVKMDRDELTAWKDWTQPRLSVKKILGESFMAAAAWQCIAAIDILRDPMTAADLPFMPPEGGTPFKESSEPSLQSAETFQAATVSLVGCNQQAIAARFIRNGN